MLGTGWTRGWGTPTATATATAEITAFTASTGSKEGHSLQDHPKATPFLLGLFILPAIRAKAPFHEQWLALLQILSNELRLFTKRIDINERDFLLEFPGLVFPFSVQREPEFRNRGSTRCIAQFRVPGEVPCEDHFVETVHLFLRPSALQDAITRSGKPF